MKISSVHAVYFSATGTTEKVVTCTAKTAAALLGANYQASSFNLPAQREAEFHFAPDSLIVFGCPVYAGRLPNLLLPFLTKNIQGNGALCIPIVLYGNRNYDDGLIELRNIMQENGFHTVSAGAFVGEHSFSTTLGAGRPNRNDLALAEKLAIETVAAIKQMDTAPEHPVSVTGCDPIRPYYTPRDRNGTPINILKVKPVTNPDTCTNCGICARICPMQAISHDDVSQVPGTCIKCCACVKKCPEQAKFFTDEGYLYHQHELEEVYARPAETEIFLPLAQV